MAVGGGLNGWRDASTLQQRLRVLHAFGLDDCDFVSALGEAGATMRSVRRWRTEVAPMRPGRQWQAIDDVGALVRVLLGSGVYDAAGALAWVRSRHDDLGQERPLDLLGSGRFADVRAAALSDISARQAEA